MLNNAQHQSKSLSNGFFRQIIRFAISSRLFTARIRTDCKSHLRKTKYVFFFFTFRQSCSDHDGEHAGFVHRMLPYINNIDPKVSKGKSFRRIVQPNKYVSSRIADRP